MKGLRRFWQFLSGGFTSRQCANEGAIFRTVIGSESGGAGNHLVEFVGGPLDGHCEQVDDLSAQRLHYFLRVAISPALVEGRRGRFSLRRKTARRTPTSLAVYELVSSDGNFSQYQFCGATRPLAAH